MWFILSLAGAGLLWDARGAAFALVEGQLDVGPQLPRRNISYTGTEPSASYRAQVQVDLARPVHVVAREYVSFALDVSQVVGGKWWNPAADQVELGSGSVRAPVFDFDRHGLDALVEALAPAYLRVGGSEADKVFYDMSARGETLMPPRFESRLTRHQWDRLHAFARRNGLQVMFTLNAGPSSRGGGGHWDDRNARRLFEYTAARGYRVALWEFGNELNAFSFLYGPNQRVSPARYDGDLRRARGLARRFFPASAFAGQGAAYWPVVGEPLSFLFGFTDDYVARSHDATDVMLWHYYPQQSRRGLVASRRAHPTRLLDPKNLDEVRYWAERIRRLRDRHSPRTPLWLGETGNAQFGGEPGVSDVYISGLWWLDQLGVLAQMQHDVVVRQTLTGMNYGMLRAEDLSPNPDYWNSLLWKRLMGRRVFAPTVEGEDAEHLRVYAHSSRRDEYGAVTLLVMNLHPQRAAEITLPQFTYGVRRDYAVTTPDILGRSVALNDKVLRLGSDGGVPKLPRVRARQNVQGDHLRVRPLSYTFVELTLPTLADARRPVLETR